jgi:hypothetical protein
MAANPSGAHQAGELSLAKHRWGSSEGFGRARHNGTSAGTPTPEQKPLVPGLVVSVEEYQL